MELGLSYVNAVLCMYYILQDGLEIREREVDRLALGAHKKSWQDIWNEGLSEQKKLLARQSLNNA